MQEKRGSSQGKMSASLALHRRIHIHKVKNMLILHTSLFWRDWDIISKRLVTNNQSHPIPKISREVSIPMPETETKKH
jgi:hypothetical protein